jgi:hypothetical protein
MVKRVSITIPEDYTVTPITGVDGDAVQAGPAATGNLETLAQELQHAETGGGSGTVGAGEGGHGEPEPPKPTNGDLLTDMIKLLRDTFCGITELQSPKRHLDDEKAAVLGQAWGAVADKHGLDLVSVAGDYATEIAAVVVTLPVAAAINTSVKAEIAERKAKEQGGAAAVPTAPGPGTITVSAAPPPSGEGVIKPRF